MFARAGLRSLAARHAVTRHAVVRHALASKAGAIVTTEPAAAEPSAPPSAAEQAPAEAELAAFRAWKAVETAAKQDSSATYPSIERTAAVFLVSGALTPAVLLVPAWAPLVLVNSAFDYFGGAGATPDGLPFFTLRMAFALVAHPAITLTCATSCALAFATQRSLFNTLGWHGGPAPWMADEARRLGQAVGLASALVSPVAVFGAHQLLTMGFLDGLVPRALILDYWGAAGGFASFSYYHVLYLASLPVTSWCAASIGPMVAPSLYARDGGAALASLVWWAVGAVGLFTGGSIWMHRQWEFSLLQNTRFASPSGNTQDDPTGENDPTAAASRQSVNEMHRSFAHDAEALAKVPGVGIERAQQIDLLLIASERATADSVKLIRELVETRLAQERKWGVKKQAEKEGPVRDEAALKSLRRQEHAEFDGHKRKLRRELESAMASAADKDLLRGLRRAEADLRELRQPSAGLSRKQLKVVNGTLEAVCEMRRRSQPGKLADEIKMMRRVARLHDHGRK